MRVHALRVKSDCRGRSSDGGGDAVSGTSGPRDGAPLPLQLQPPQPLWTRGGAPSTAAGLASSNPPSHCSKNTETFKRLARFLLSKSRGLQN